MICTICACNNSEANADSTNESGNFSSEMVIENATEVPIVVMPEN